MSAKNRVDDTNWSLEKRLYEDCVYHNGRELEDDNLVRFIYRQLVSQTNHVTISRQEELTFIKNLDLTDYFDSMINMGKKYKMQDLVNKQIKEDKKKVKYYLRWINDKINNGQS